MFSKSTKKLVRQVSDISAKVCPAAASKYIYVVAAETVVIRKKHEAICEGSATRIPLRHCGDVGDVVVQSVALSLQRHTMCCLLKSNSGMVMGVPYTPRASASNYHIKEHYYQTRSTGQKRPTLLQFADTDGCIVVYYIRQRSQFRVYVTDRMSSPSRDKNTDDPRLFYKTQIGDSGKVVYESSKHRGYFLTMNGNTLSVKKKTSKIFTDDFLFQVRPYN